MFFISGFRKTAAFTNHSDGSEWKISDTEPAPYAAGAVETAHQSTFRYLGSTNNLNKNNTLDASNAARALLKKKASPITGALDYVGTRSDAADTLATQLKWDTSGDDVPENMGYHHNKAKRLPKAKNKGQTT